MLGPMLDRLARLATDLAFFAIIYKTDFHLVLAYVALRRRQEVDWSCIDLEDPFFFYHWRVVEVIGLADKRVHELKCEFDGQFVYHEHRLRAIAVQFWAGICPGSIDEAIPANRVALVDKKPDWSCGGIIAAVPPGAGDEEGDWNVEYIVAGPSTRQEELRVVFNSLRGMLICSSFPSPIRAWMSCAMPSMASMTFLR